MRIMVLGLRGFPGIQGGVETHAQHLYPKLRDLGCDIEVLVRSRYWPSLNAERIPGIRFTPLWCPSSNGAEAFVHSLLGVLYAAWRRPDILHIHAIGPALFAPLAKLLGLRVVVTHHGPDYDREKWSPTAKVVLRLGERLGMWFADERIVISHVIGDLVRQKYHRESICIVNGVEIPSPVDQTHSLNTFGLELGRYVLNVSRMVPEKRHLDLIEAFQLAELHEWKLVLVGDLRPDDPYVEDIKAAANALPNVVLAGFQTGIVLAQIYANAGLFALPSTHEGLPIALLEALSFGLPSIASNIPANRELGLNSDQYFHVRDVYDLARCIKRNATVQRDIEYRNKLQEWVKAKYDWSAIAQKTLAVYTRVAQHHHVALRP